jgi:hypothetical protein
MMRAAAQRQDIRMRVHDDITIAAPPEYADQITKLAISALAKVGLRVNEDNRQCCRHSRRLRSRTTIRHSSSSFSGPTCLLPQQLASNMSTTCHSNNAGISTTSNNYHFIPKLPSFSLIPDLGGELSNAVVVCRCATRCWEGAVVVCFARGVSFFCRPFSAVFCFVLAASLRLCVCCRLAAGAHSPCFTPSPSVMKRTLDVPKCSRSSRCLCRST